jgi:hypothetical protein
MAEPDRRRSETVTQSTLVVPAEPDRVDVPRRVIRQITSDDATAVYGEIRGLQILIR